MKRLLIAAILAVGPAYADLIATNSGGDELRLMHSPCTHGGVLGHLDKDKRVQFKKAQSWVQGKLLYACWIDTGDGAYWVVYEDGEGKPYSITSFIDKPGV